MPHTELSTTGGGQGHLIIRELEGLEKKAIFRSKIPVCRMAPPDTWSNPRPKL